MRIIFAGTPEFSKTILQSLIDSDHEIVAVYTQPDRPKGRGQKLTASPVKELSLEHNLDVQQPKTLRDESTQAHLKSYDADIMVVVAYGLILPQAVLDTPKHGCLNIHASLLPRWRGAAPIQRAIEAGDEKTGITIMQMDAGLDTGDMLLKSECKITDTTTSASLHDELSIIGAKAIVDALNQLNNLTPEKQDDALVTYAEKIQKQEGDIDWSQDAKTIHQKIRAFNPWPCCFSGELKIWEASVINQTSDKTPSTILKADKEGLDVTTGNGILRILRCQLPGKKPLTVAELLNSKKDDFKPGNSLQ